MKCGNCGKGLIPKRKWTKMTAAERTASGKASGVRGQCTSCSNREYRAGKSSRSTWKLPELIEEAEFLIQGGVTPAMAAERLGIKPDSLARSYDRARKQGLVERSIRYAYRRRHK